MNTSATMILIGRLTRDSELKFLPSGMAVLNFSVVTSTAVKKGDQWTEEPSFWDCAVFGSDAEKKAEKLKKGSGVRVIGNAKIESWEKDGQKQHKAKIAATSVDSWYYGQTTGSSGENARQTPPRSTSGNSRQQAQAANDDFEDFDDFIPF